MRIGAFEINEPVPELHEPHAIAMVRPWVDVGSVGTLTLRRLERHFGAKEVGKLARPGHFFDFTRYRPTTRFVDGKRVVTVPNSTINYAQPEDGPDLLFFHLLEPHAMGEDYTESVVEVFKFFGVSRYCRLGAMYDAVPHTRPLLVTGALGGATPLEGKKVPIRERQSRYHGQRLRVGHRHHESHGPPAPIRPVGGRLPRHVPHAGRAVVPLQHSR